MCPVLIISHFFTWLAIANLMADKSNFFSLSAHKLPLCLCVCACLTIYIHPCEAGKKEEKKEMEKSAEWSFVKCEVMQSGSTPLYSFLSFALPISSSPLFSLFHTSTTCTNITAVVTESVRRRARHYLLLEIKHHSFLSLSGEGRISYSSIWFTFFFKREKVIYANRKTMSSFMKDLRLEASSPISYARSPYPRVSAYTDDDGSLGT